jgi:hypothetical protein
MRWDERLGVEVVRATAVAADPSLADRLVVGVGWATVDLDRAALQAGNEDGSICLPAPRDALLGARAMRRADEASGAPVLVLLEPDTEGRIAASLARFGEGVAAIYLAADDRDAERPSTTRSRVGPICSGPLGAGRLLLGLPPSGPHVIVLEPGGAVAEGART